jgi:hypothetical protein
LPLAHDGSATDASASGYLTGAKAQCSPSQV